LTNISHILDLWHEKCRNTQLHYLEIRPNPTDQKKGAKAQQQIARLQSQVAAGGTPEQKRKEAEKARREAEKKAAEAAKAEVAALFKPVQVQKIPFGADPKSVLCQFFKAGNCEKGTISLMPLL